MKAIESPLAGTAFHCSCDTIRGGGSTSRGWGRKKKSKVGDNQVNFAIVFAFRFGYSCSQVKLPQVKQTSYVYGLSLSLPQLLPQLLLLLLPHTLAALNVAWGISFIIVSRGCHQDYLQVKLLLLHTCVWGLSLCACVCVCRVVPAWVCVCVCVCTTRCS